MAIIAEVKALFGVDVPTVVLFKDPVVSAIVEAVSTLMQGGGSEGPVAIAPRVTASPRASEVPVPMAGWNTSCMLGGPAPAGGPPVPLNYQTVSYSIWITDGDDGTQFQRDWFKAALWEVHARHEALRGHFLLAPAPGGDTELQFKVTPLEDFVLPLVERDLVAEDVLGGGSAEEKEAQAVKIAEDLYAFDGCFEPFDPFMQRSSNGPGPREGGLGPLAHFYLLRVTESKWYFFYGMHHAIFDGYSDEIFWTDLNEAYLAAHHRAANTEAPPRALPPAVHYPDFALWQAETVFPSEIWASAIQQAALDCFSPGAATAPLPDKTGVPCENKIRHSVWYRGGPWVETTVGIPPEVCETLSTLAQSEGGTLFMAVVAAFHVWQHTHQPDKAEAMLGVTLLGRPDTQPGLKRVMGNFQESASVRTPLASCTSYMDVLRATKQPFIRMKELADEGAATYDHASWAAMLEGTPKSQLPAEVAEYMYGRPKAYLNFQDMGYGEATTAGLTAAGLRAWNSVEPVAKDQYLDSGDAASAADAAPAPAPVAAAEQPEFRLAEDGTAWVLSDGVWTLDEDFEAAEDVGAEEAAVAMVGEPVDVCDAYMYPSLTPGDYGTRSEEMGHRDINDYELYFSFLRGDAATDDTPRGAPDARRILATSLRAFLTRSNYGHRSGRAVPWI